MSETNVDLMAKAPTGELRKTGLSGRVYIFGFGWMARLNLESFYGRGLAQIGEDTDQANVIANVLLASLKTRPANNLPADFSREQMYALLDDLSEADVTEAWQAAKFSLGFTNRILGVSEEDVRELAQQALKSAE